MRRLVISGLGDDWSKDAAEKRVQEKMQNAGAPKASEVFSKGEFKGMLFARCESAARRDISVDRFRRAS